MHEPLLSLISTNVILYPWKVVKNRRKYFVVNLAKLYRNDALCMSIQLCSLREMKPNKIDIKVLCCSRKYKFNMPPYQELHNQINCIVN